MQPEIYIYIYWQIAEINHWKDIVLEQKALLVETGLFDLAKEIKISFLGKDRKNINFLLETHKKFNLYFYSNDLLLYERPSFVLMQNDAAETNKDYNIFYFHVKGVCHKDNIFVQQWRQMLQKHLITNYNECISLLKRYDVLGCYLHDAGPDNNFYPNVFPPHKKHFAGNFFWTKASHVRTLPSLNMSHLNLSETRVRFLYERWILYNDTNFFEVYKDPNGHRHFYHQSPS